MKTFLICWTMLFFVFVNDVSARLGGSFKGNGLSFGDLRSDGETLTGFSFALGSLDSRRFEEINGISFSLGTAARRINGISFSPFFAGAGHSTKGLTISPLVVSRGEVKGIAVGGLLARGEITGIAVAPFVGGNFSSIPISILNFTLPLNVVGYGAYFSLPSDTGDAVTGIAIFAGLQGGDITGLAIGASSNANKVRGFVLAPLYTMANELHGIQIGGILNNSTKTHGVQISIVNIAEELHGIQIGGLLNYSVKTHGIQISIFNFAEELHGHQIGILNIAWNNPWYLRILPFINVHD